MTGSPALRILAVLLVTAALVLASCGDDDDTTAAEGSTPGPTATTDPTPEASATPGATPSPSASATPSVTPTPTPTEEPSPTPTPDGWDPAFVEDASVSADGVLTVEGDLPTPCHVVADEAAEGPDGSIDVTVYSELPDADEICAAVLSPFSAQIDLPLGGDLCAVAVNGQRVESDVEGCTDRADAPR